MYGPTLQPAQQGLVAPLNRGHVNPAAVVFPGFLPQVPSVPESRAADGEGEAGSRGQKGGRTLLPQGPVPGFSASWRPSDRSALEFLRYLWGLSNRNRFPVLLSSARVHFHHSQPKKSLKFWNEQARAKSRVLAHHIYSAFPNQIWCSPADPEATMRPPCLSTLWKTWKEKRSLLFHLPGCGVGARRS